jgi:hypothetical protein
MYDNFSAVRWRHNTIITALFFGGGGAWIDYGRQVDHYLQQGCKTRQIMFFIKGFFW